MSECDAEWSWDVDFYVMCGLAAGHAGAHVAKAQGNDNSMATITWGAIDPTPAQIVAETRSRHEALMEAKRVRESAVAKLRRAGLVR